MRRVTAIVVALLLAGCGVRGEPVALLTDDLGCYAGGEGGPTGPLVADTKLGVTFMGRQVMWPLGYSGRRSGAEIVVVDRFGRERARTGRIYHISFAHSLGIIAAGGPGDPYPAAVECGYPWDFIDCTANPGNEYCRPD